VALLALVAERTTQRVEASDDGVQARLGLGKGDGRVALNCGQLVGQGVDGTGDVFRGVAWLVDALHVLDGAGDRDAAGAAGVDGHREVPRLDVRCAFRRVEVDLQRHGQRLAVQARAFGK